MSRAKTQKVAQNAVSRIVQSVNRQNPYAMLYYNQKGAIDKMKYLRYKVEIAFEQYEGFYVVEHKVAAVDFEQAKKSALEKFWYDHGKQHNLRIHHITITEYN